MIKIVSHILFSFLFLISTSGLTISVHYCQNKIYDISIFSHAHSCCGEMMHHHTDDCGQCKDRTFQTRVKDDYTSTVFDFNFNLSQAENAFLQQSFLYTIFPEHIIKEDIPKITISPPLTSWFLSFIQTYLL